MNSTPRSPNFPATRWSLVVASQNTHDPRASAAMEDLCRLYWYPVYAHIRRLGRPHDEAEDLTQAFFQTVIEKQKFSKAQAEKGRFRTFLLTSLKHFLISKHDHDMAQKRAPQRAIAFDALEAEERYRAEPQENSSPDVQYDRRCFRAVLDACTQELRDAWAADGRAAIFDALEERLTDTGQEKESRKELAARLGISVVSLEASRTKLREQFRTSIHEKIAETLHHPTKEDIKAELDILTAGCSS